MKCLVIGYNGFIGTHLCKKLENKYEVVYYNGEIPLDVDRIYYCAGIMRNEDKELFYTVNYKMVKNIIEYIRPKNIDFIYLSSMQYEQDNDYGRSKRLGEIATLEYNRGFVYRLRNTFGAGAKPNYNSVVSTFLYNIKNNLPIQIKDRSIVMELNYIDDVIATLKNFNHKGINYKIEEIAPIYKITLGELADTIYRFKQGVEPIIDLEGKLYETYKQY